MDPFVSSGKSMIQRIHEYPWFFELCQSSPISTDLGSESSNPKLMQHFGKNFSYYTPQNKHIAPGKIGLLFEEKNSSSNPGVSGAMSVSFRCRVVNHQIYKSFLLLAFPVAEASSEAFSHPGLLKHQVSRTHPPTSGPGKYGSV